MPIALRISKGDLKMMWNKANKILELEESNNAYANAQNLLNDKIGQLDNTILILQAHLDKAEVDRDEFRAGLDLAVVDLAETKADLDKKEAELTDLTSDYISLSKDYDMLITRNDILEMVLKQCNILVTPGKKK